MLLSKTIAVFMAAFSSSGSDGGRGGIGLIGASSAVASVKKDVAALVDTNVSSGKVARGPRLKQKSDSSAYQDKLRTSDSLKTDAVDFDAETGKNLGLVGRDYDTGNKKEVDFNDEELKLNSFTGMWKNASASNNEDFFQWGTADGGIIDVYENNIYAANEVFGHQLELVKDFVESEVLDFFKFLGDSANKVMMRITTWIHENLGLKDWDDFLKNVILNIENFFEWVESAMEEFIDLCQWASKILDTFKEWFSFKGMEEMGTSRIAENYIGAFDSRDDSYLSVNDSLEVQKGGLRLLAIKLATSVASSIVKEMGAHIYAMITGNGDNENEIETVMDAVAKLAKSAASGVQDFVEDVCGNGSLQFLVSFGGAKVVGVGGEIGVSISCDHIAYLIENGTWDKYSEFPTVATVHVAYEVSVGAQAGADLDISVGYHSSEPTGTNGFGWGFGVELGLEMASVGIGWPIPGNLVPNQYVYPLGDADFKPSAVFGFNHALIFGSWSAADGWKFGLPTAKDTGEPWDDWLAFSWNQIISSKGPKAEAHWEVLGWTQCSWDHVQKKSLPPSGRMRTCNPPSSFGKNWDKLSAEEKNAAFELGFMPKTWDAPLAHYGWKYQEPLDEYFRHGGRKWKDLSPLDKEALGCLGFHEKIFNDGKVSWAWNTVKWDELSAEMKVCASAIGYSSLNWNDKLRSGKADSCTPHKDWCDLLGGDCCWGPNNCYAIPRDQSGLYEFRFGMGHCFSPSEKRDLFNKRPVPWTRSHRSPIPRPKPRPKPTPKPRRKPKADKWKNAIHAEQIDMKTDIPPACLDNNYNVELTSVMDDDEGSHFVLTAKVSSEENPSYNDKCPNFLTFTSIDEQKFTHRVHDSTKFNEYMSFLLGEASLKEIMNAESSVAAIKDSEYDLTNNSCIHYAGRIWRELHFNETNELANFLIDNLLRNDGFLNIARHKSAAGGLRILYYVAGKGSLKDFVKDLVYSQLNIKDDLGESPNGPAEI